MYDPHLTPLVYPIHHTILAMAISCKGQGERRAMGKAPWPLHDVAISNIV